MGDLRSRLERKDGEAPRKIPMAERSQTLDLLKQDLPGITIDLQLEPAHKLVDLVKEQVEDNCIRYIALKECLSRSSELLNHKHESAVEFSGDGTLRLTKKQKELHADVQGDLKLKMAFQRRALAYHMAGASSFLVQDKIISSWFALLTKEPASGYRSVSLQQLVLADQELWLQAAQEVRGKNLQATPKPLDEVLQSLQQSAEVRYHLLPLPAGSKDQPKRSEENPRKKPKPGPSNSRNKGSNKGSGKGQINLPSNCVATTPSGSRICFQYNRDRCNLQSAHKCHRGLHVCWKQGCHGKHSHMSCAHS